jgi:hypothetical protein
MKAMKRVSRFASCELVSLVCRMKGHGCSVPSVNLAEGVVNWRMKYLKTLKLRLKLVVRYLQLTWYCFKNPSIQVFIYFQEGMKRFRLLCL